MTFTATFTNYTALVSELPHNRGQLIIQKYDSWNCHLEFYTEDLPLGNYKMFPVKRWIGQWRVSANPPFNGWYQMFTESELIPLSAITTGKIQDNFFVTSDCTDGGYYKETDGTWVNAYGTTTTNIIPASAYEKLAMYTNVTTPNHIITFWDSDGNFLSGAKHLPENDKFMRFIIPKGASGFRCSFMTSQKEYIEIGHETVQQDNLDEYVKSINNDFFKGKKMNCLGDSITYGYTPSSGTQMSRPYPTVVKELLGLETVRNYGISGSTLAVGGDEPMVTRYSDMDDDADIICVFGGTNDWGKADTSKQRALGTIDSTDNTSIYGALNELCSGLITKYPKATIFLITPLRRANDTTVNTQNYVLKDIADAIKEVGAKFSIPVLDLFSCGNFYPTNSTQNTQLSGDGLHPNQWYHENILAPKIAGFLR